jgi:hypothetical protein
MSYYPTLTEDVKRAKAILDRGKAEPPGLPMPEHVHFGGTILGADTYAAYKLLESFVEAIEVVGPKVCELALRHERRQQGETR